MTHSIFLHGFWAVFGVGCCGGAVGNLLNILEVGLTGVLPQYAKRPSFWFSLLVLAAIGGGLTVLYGYDEVQGVLALNIGASAPLILKSLASAVPKLEKPRVD